MLASPTSFAAKQEYTPASASPTAARLSRGLPGTWLLRCPRGSPSFSQVTAGAGDPVASQLKVTSEPSATICSSLLSGLSRTGGTGEGAVPLSGAVGAKLCPQALGMGLAVPWGLASTQMWLSLPAGCSGTAFRLVLPRFILSEPTPVAKGWLRTPHQKRGRKEQHVLSQQN